jgi:hypothetical protein
VLVLTSGSVCSVAVGSNGSGPSPSTENTKLKKSDSTWVFFWLSFVTGDLSSVGERWSSPLVGRVFYFDLM